jgi:two-component system, cell cycle sensor histidine kinase and response regulator CckA
VDIASPLEESTSRAQDLAEDSPIGMYVGTRSGRLEWVNHALVRMLGYDSPAELLAVRTSDLYRDPAARTRALRQFEAGGRHTGVEVEWNRRDGRPITLRLWGRTVTGRRDGDDAFEVVAEDVTECRTVEEQLRLSQKMEAIGRLAGGIAHDFNNMLTAILGYSENLLQQLDETKPVWRDLMEIRSAADRAAALTRQLLAFSRQQVLRLEPVDLNAIVRGIEQMIRRLIGENIAVETSLCPSPCFIMGDRSQLEQVIVNLAVNARDAMPRGGRLSMQTRLVVLGDHYLTRHPGAAPGRHAMLAVCDDGIGMDEATKARIFDPFFTTKEHGKGTGLGLATVYGTVKQLGGCIWAYSEKGLGTTFKLYFPERSGMAVEPPRRTAARQAPSVGSEAVLVVEDERAVRTFCCTVLRRFGYRVTEAASPAEALSVMDGLPVDLVLTDFMMPGMSGDEMIRRVRAMRPSVKALCMSGYAENSALVHRRLEGDVRLLEKPFTSADLLQAVRQTLDSPAPADQ